MFGWALFLGRSCCCMNDPYIFQNCSEDRSKTGGSVRSDVARSQAQGKLQEVDSLAFFQELALHGSAPWRYSCFKKSTLVGSGSFSRTDRASACRMNKAQTCTKTEEIVLFLDD